MFRVLNDQADAHDCYQDVFLEAFQQTRGQKVRDWPSLLRWLSVRRAIDRLRQRRRTAALGVAVGDAVQQLADRDGMSAVVELATLAPGQSGDSSLRLAGLRSKLSLLGRLRVLRMMVSATLPLNPRAVGLLNVIGRRRSCDRQDPMLMD